MGKEIIGHIDDEALIEQIKIILRIPEGKGSVYHKVEEWKLSFKKQIEDYRAIEKVIDPGKPAVKKTRKEFEIRKTKRKGWMVNPDDIPVEVINHILAKKCKPGLIKMQKFTLANGTQIDLTFEKQSVNFFIGSILTVKSEKETPKQAVERDKTEDLKKFLTYLMNNENFCDWLIGEFLERWKPAIDNDFIFNER